MQNPKHPSGDSSTTDGKSPPSSPEHPPPPPPSDDDTNTNIGDLSLTIQNTNNNSGGRDGKETKIMKTALEVLAELASDESNNDVGGDGGGMGQSGGSVASVAVAVGSAGGSVAVVQGGGGRYQGRAAGKRRKVSHVKDPPRGKPTCPSCNKEFRSWKGAFGHQRKHPERNYRGFNEPPSFTTPSSLRAGEGEGARTAGDRAAAPQPPPAGGLPFDLNQPVSDVSGSSNVADQGNEEAQVSPPAAEEKNLGFDLNALPTDEDDNEDN
ncbi:hypothetical protein Lal_00025845 [Lupinus albus]|nr:hypothetical protein Lal_00025845 [Lupinus albus]